MLILGSSDCLDEAKRRVYADPSSNRSWNFCWLVLVKIQSECVINNASNLALQHAHSQTANSSPTTHTTRRRCQQCGATRRPPRTASRGFATPSSQNGRTPSTRCYGTGNGPQSGVSSSHCPFSFNGSHWVLIKFNTSISGESVEMIAF